MDFNPETQSFRLTSEEADILHIHPAWMECSRVHALKLFTLIARNTHVTLEQPGGDALPPEELERQSAAVRLAHSLLSQLEPFVNTDIQALSDQLPPHLPDGLE